MGSHQLARDHWEWIASLLGRTNTIVTALHKFLYIEAFKHGYKHAEQELTQSRDSSGRFVR